MPRRARIRRGHASTTVTSRPSTKAGASVTRQHPAPKPLIPTLTPTLTLTRFDRGFISPYFSTNPKTQKAEPLHLTLTPNPKPDPNLNPNPNQNPNPNHDPNHDPKPDPHPHPHLNPHPNPNPNPNQAEFENPYILLVEKKVSTLQTLLPLLEQALYLVITPKHMQTLLPLLEQARYLVITPMHRQALLP